MRQSSSPPSSAMTDCGLVILAICDRSTGTPGRVHSGSPACCVEVCAASRAPPSRGAAPKPRHRRHGTGGVSHPGRFGSHGLVPFLERCRRPPTTPAWSGSANRVPALSENKSSVNQRFVKFLQCGSRAFRGHCFTDDPMRPNATRVGSNQVDSVPMRSTVSIAGCALSAGPASTCVRNS